jgi:hypothetical protein
MSQPMQLSPSTSPKSPLNPQPYFSCRWDWCRLTFPTNALLVDHVIHEHVRSAQPVRRRDLPMLRRVEEGVGESLRFTMSGGTGEFFLVLVLCFGQVVRSCCRCIDVLNIFRPRALPLISGEGRDLPKRAPQHILKRLIRHLYFSFR